MKYILGILFSLLTTCLFAQEKERPLIQFTGIIHSADSVKAIVPYASIVNLSYNKQSVTSNYEGYFSFVVHERDSIRFSCVGYAPVTIVIPENVANKSLIMPVFLKPQIFNLPTARVFPWATVDEFRKYFLTMKVADDDLAIVIKNLNGTSRQAMQRGLTRDGSESIANEMHNSVVNSHSRTNPLINPFAWGALIKQITAGDKKRQATQDDAGYNF